MLAGGQLNLQWSSVTKAPTPASCESYSPALTMAFESTYVPLLQRITAHRCRNCHGSLVADFVSRRVQLGASKHSPFEESALVNTSFQVHDGFMKSHAATATTILAAVRQVISERSATKVLAVGHSLGTHIHRVMRG
jgi:hypothetical protein